MNTFVRTLIAGAFAAAVLAAGAPARASNTLTTTVGPLSIPSVPVSICLDSTCVSTPALTSVTIVQTVTVDGLVLPIVTPGLCPNGGAGVVLTVSSLTPASATITETVSGVGADGQPFSQTIGPRTVTLGLGGPGFTVNACT